MNDVLPMPTGVLQLSDDEWVVILEDDRLLPVTDWIDEEGDFCDPDDAIVCVAGDEEFGWITLELDRDAGIVVN